MIPSDGLSLDVRQRYRSEMWSAEWMIALDIGQISVDWKVISINHFLSSLNLWYNFSLKTIDSFGLFPLQQMQMLQTNQSSIFSQTQIEWQKSLLKIEQLSSEFHENVTKQTSNQIYTINMTERIFVEVSTILQLQPLEQCFSDNRGNMSNPSSPLETQFVKQY